MKENKLIELLDEYDSVQYHKINHKIENWEIYRNVWGTDGWHQVWRYCKQFWFIKRLVENDKIDKYKVIELEHNWIRPFKLDNLYWEIKLEERLLMLLSIQDNPIEFLISVLKQDGEVNKTA